MSLAGAALAALRAAGLLRDEVREERMREALAGAHDAIKEYERYWYGGEMRGSYDGKPERAGLWKAMHRTRAALEDKR